MVTLQRQGMTLRLSRFCFTRRYSCLPSRNPGCSELTMSQSREKYNRPLSTILVFFRNNNSVSSLRVQQQLYAAAACCMQQLHAAARIFALLAKALHVQVLARAPVIVFTRVSPNVSALFSCGVLTRHMVPVFLTLSRKTPN